MEIVHGAHGCWETNSPVRTFVPFEIKTAAYTCTPLVKFPLADLKAGTRVELLWPTSIGRSMHWRGEPERPSSFAPEPLDQALLSRQAWVVDSTGSRVEGEVSVGSEETAWLFGPRTEWLPGNYLIEVDVVLEDLAGNTIGQPFEVDVFERVRQQVTRSTVRLAFVIQ